MCRRNFPRRRPCKNNPRSRSVVRGFGSRPASSPRASITPRPCAKLRRWHLSSESGQIRSSTTLRPPLPTYLYIVRSTRKPARKRGHGSALKGSGLFFGDAGLRIDHLDASWEVNVSRRSDSSRLNPLMERRTLFAKGVVAAPRHRVHPTSTRTPKSKPWMVDRPQNLEMVLIDWVKKRPDPFYRKNNATRLALGGMTQRPFLATATVAPSQRACALSSGGKQITKPPSGIASPDNVRTAPASAGT